METQHKAGVAMVVTTLAVAFIGMLAGWETNTFITVGFIAGGLAAALVTWGSAK